MKIGRALISVHDKTGVVELAAALVDIDVEILSTGGTAQLLRESGVAVRDVAEVTGFPEMLDGRVKTLHPRIHGGILARRDSAAHMAALEQHAIGPIDLVVAGLYPFEATVAQPGVNPEEAIEQIDIGGPAMIRAAAKNHPSVAVVTAVTAYPLILQALTDGGFSLTQRKLLAARAFADIAEYDVAMANWCATTLAPSASRIASTS